MCFKMFSLGNQPSQSLVLVVIFVLHIHHQECKEVLSSQTPSVILSQKSEFQEESQLFTHLHLAEMEKVFEDDIHSPAGKAALEV